MILDLKIQLFQPYFYYSIVFSIISSICVVLIAKYNSFLSTRTKSIMYIIPLAIPAFVMLVFPPQLVIRMVEVNRAELLRNYEQTNRMPPLFPLNPYDRIPFFHLAFLNFVSIVEIPSITGIICMIGVALASVYFMVMLVFGKSITMKIFNVVELEQEELIQLRSIVRKISRKLNLQPPKIGIIEDLRPNAFTLGYGSNATIVFSTGIIKILNKDELEAVVAHELHHIKNNDFFYKLISLTLSILSFFNPVSYLLAMIGQRERELLADEESMNLLERPKLLAKALKKAYEASSKLPEEGIILSLVSGLFLASPMAIKDKILLQTHPKLDQRLAKINNLEKKKHRNSSNYMATLIFSTFVILFGIIITYPFISIQISFMKEQLIIPAFRHPRFSFVHIFLNERQSHRPYFNLLEMKVKLNNAIFVHSWIKF